ncbi:Toluene efflux pump periplasmic linker protein TtgG precursor [Maioricimonas rarisocia]|uniref:Toluene efflux pump periplasmic linker protein TtgG n=1 Tax=Maioricimonas rarisocia TaxID=2528026 RepID=A0A517Z6K9_9PLAN|nr:efflux RND transporter periplasmic adaptor subunit [Maioricimonas rarisocia]QDU38051.1 Toluene efflux pump periplasmic linker protein TtgG precursor [Maioricimonas rarisocia]
MVASTGSTSQATSTDARTGHRPPARRSPFLLRHWRGIVTPFLCAAALFIGFNVFYGLSGLKEEPPRETPAPKTFQVQVYRTESANLRKIISAFGTARSDRAVVVSAEVSGRITRNQLLQEGVRVHAKEVEILPNGQSLQSPGDVVVEIDPQTYRERLQQAHARIDEDEAELKRLKLDHANNQRLLAQQQANLKTAKDDYDRARRLLEQGAGRQSAVNLAELEVARYKEAILQIENEIALHQVRVEQVESRLTTHRSDLRLAEIELEKTRVAPPFTGQIDEVMVEEGQYVRIGDPLFTITNNDTVEVPVAISLSNAASLGSQIQDGRVPIARLAENEVATPRWSGVVRRIAPVADQQTRTVTVYVEVDNRDQPTPLLPGSFVHARIDGQVLTDTLLIPRDALVSGSVFVVRRDNSGSTPSAEADELAPEAEYTAVQQSVEVESTFQSFASISSGLKPGDAVVLTNLDVIETGALLRVRGIQTLEDELDRHKIPYLQRIHGPIDAQATSTPPPSNGPAQRQ